MPEPRLRQPALDSAPIEAKALDRVFVHDLVLDAELGVYTHEKGVTQRVRFSVDVDLIPAAQTLGDDIAPRPTGTQFLRHSICTVPGACETAHLFEIEN